MKPHTLSTANLDVVPDSCVVAEGAEWALARTEAGLRLVVHVPPAAAIPSGVEGEVSEHLGGTLLVGPLSAQNAAALRRTLSWLRPRPLGVRTSAGMGDRLGLATVGHARALKAVGGAIAPIFAQQSIREMTRTGRSPRQVIDDATWGAFEAGWTGTVGADADHLKNTADIDDCLAAGFSLFTIDPGTFVDERADTAGLEALQAAVAALPWDVLEDSEASFRQRYAGRTIDIEGHLVRFDEASVLRAGAKYGRAVAHVVRMYRHLAGAARDRDFELEVSVDETDTPTTFGEHVYLASELRRLGVRWVSLAPRYSGRFEKGVDFIGDLAQLDAEMAAHAAIARQFGPYKLSLHSGSDKFSVYPGAVRHTRGVVHLKTAGTSYLEALRAVARVDPGLFRCIYAFSRDQYETERASYHVSASVARTADPGTVMDADLPALLDEFDPRQILHVTYGSVLTARTEDGRPRFADRLLATLRAHRDVYGACLETHFVRHLAPFAPQAP